MTVYANTTGLVTGDNAYIKFASSDTSLQNTRYEVLFANATMLRVTHKNIASATSLSGAANVHTNVLTLTSNYHGLDDMNLCSFISIVVTLVMLLTHYIRSLV